MRHSILPLVALLIGTTGIRSGEPPDPAALAAKIDARLSAAWAAAGVKPTPATDDAAYLRRVSLDLIGRIPTVAETREFLADTSADKRTKLTRRLIDSAAHTRHVATFWRRVWLPQADSAEFARLGDDFEAWVALRLREGMPLDKMVRDLLSADATRGRGVGPAGFFTASENKPENLAANATRAFLGVNLDCAQCHDHPFARWTRDQFWQTATFFAAPLPDKGGTLTPPELTVPGTTKVRQAEYPDGGKVAWPPRIAPDSGRKLLADWLTAGKNPWFARNAVNRLWSQFYGTALVEPLDDLSGDAAGEGLQAALLGEIAEAFTASGFDLKYLTRALTLTRAYQLSSVVRDESPTDPRLFARMPVRGMTGEQLHDSLRTAAGLPPERDDVVGPGQEARKRFIARFYVERPVSAERSIVQALSAMNGRLTAALTKESGSPILTALGDAPFLDDRERIDTLFLATLSRRPTDAEAARVSRHMEGRASRSEAARALADVLWALINATEFNTNH